MILRVRDDEGNIFDIPAIRGLSSYELAVKHGFVGTEEEWLESIGVEKGDSAYQVWLDAGNEGDVAAFLAAIKGEQGVPGDMPNISIKEVKTLTSAEEAYVEIDISEPANPKLSFGIPQGEKGATGATGPQGPKGDTGPQGPAGSSATGLPSVSSSDNGKFLRVVSGSWSAVSISSAEGVSF